MESERDEKKWKSSYGFRQTTNDDTDVMWSEDQKLSCQIGFLWSFCFCYFFSGTKRKFQKEKEEAGTVPLWGEILVMTMESEEMN